MCLSDVAPSRTITRGATRASGLVDLRDTIIRGPALDHVQNEHVSIGAEADGCHDVVEQLSGAADERLALEILLLARPFADDDQGGLGIPSVDHDVVPGLSQNAAGALGVE